MPLREGFKIQMRQKVVTDPELKATLLEEADHQAKNGELETAQVLRSIAGVQVRPSIALELHREDIRRIVEKYRFKNPMVFGSVVRGEDTEDSDLDILVDKEKGANLFSFLQIQSELSVITGVRVHVATTGSIRAQSKIESILAQAIPI